MTKQTLIAPDMRVALKLVKARFGENALILDTRTRKSRVAGSLQLKEEVEVIVGLPGPGEAHGVPRRAGAASLPGSSGEVESPEPPRRLDDELARLESLLEEFEAQLALPGGRGDFEKRYPLTPALEELGLSPAALNRLAIAHAEEVPPVDQNDPLQAVDRLASCLRCVEAMELEDLRGHHALLGRPGTGKTTLALKLASHVAAGGCRAAVLSYAPDPRGMDHLLEEAAERYGIETALASDADALRGALHYLRGSDLFILDLPGLAEAQWALLDEAEKALDGEPLLRHFVVPADGGWRALDDTLARCDYLAVSRADLASPAIPSLDLCLAPEGRFNLSFQSAGSNPREGLALLLPDALLASLRARFTRAERAEAGGRS